MNKLTAQQNVFVSEYLKDLNATQAAIRAGYSAKNAESVACRLIKKSQVQEAIQEALKNREKRTQITADRVLTELGKIAFSDYRRVATWNGNGFNWKNDDEIEEDDAACIKEISETIGDQGGGSRSVKLHDKMKALELIAKHLGMFNGDKADDSETDKRNQDDLDRGLSDALSRIKRS